MKQGPFLRFHPWWTDLPDNTLCLQLEAGNISHTHIAHTMTVNEKSVQIGSAHWNVGFCQREKKNHNLLWFAGDFFVSTQMFVLKLVQPQSVCVL